MIPRNFARCQPVLNDMNITHYNRFYISNVSYVKSVSRKMKNNNYLIDKKISSHCQPKVIDGSTTLLRPSGREIRTTIPPTVLAVPATRAASRWPRRAKSRYPIAPTRSTNRLNRHASKWEKFDCIITEIVGES